MPEIPISIQIADMWGDATFTRNTWGAINYLVGPNGTGKSRFADQLKTTLTNAAYQVRFLNAERLAGFEKQNYSTFTHDQLGSGLDIRNFSSYKTKGEQYGLSTSAFVLLKERLDIRIKIEAFLSDMFSKSIRLVEEGGFLKPKVQNIDVGDEYEIKSAECHGLKELITLLTFLVDSTKNCIILDEPELHLHPQFQSFLFSKIRELAGDPLADPSKKLFFIITHSPYFLDFQTIDDLKNVVVFQPDSLPKFANTFTPDDEFILKRFLPRFNTHHKQFFFSSVPVFVEGYTDQQIVALLYERIGKNIGAAGSCVVDVGGKDELAVFFRLCKTLGITPRILADLDALFEGKLRQVVCEDAASNAYLQTEGIGQDMQVEVGDLQQRLKSIADIIRASQSNDPEVSRLIDSLNDLADENDEIPQGKMPEYRLRLLLGIVRYRAQILTVVPQQNQGEYDLISGRFAKLLEASVKAGVYFLPKGELEHYYTQTQIDYLAFSDQVKNAAFHTERDHLLASAKATIEADYAELIGWLNEAVPNVEVDFRSHIRFQVIEWIQNVQLAVERGEVASLDQLQSNGRVNYSLFSQLFEANDFTIGDGKQFSCTITLADSLAENTAPITFTHATPAAEIQIADNA